MRTSFLTPRLTPVGVALIMYWRSSMLPPSFAGRLWIRRTRRHALICIVAALIVGKRFCSIVDISFSSCTLASKPESTSSGADCHTPAPALCGRRIDALTSETSEYASTLNVSVGPRGARTSRR